MKPLIPPKLRVFSVMSSGIFFMALTLILVKLIALPAPFVAMLRALIACILLSLFFPTSLKLKLEKGSHYLLMIGSAVCLALSWTLLFESLEWTSVAVAVTAYFMFPIWTVFRNLSSAKPITLMDLVMIVGFGGALYLLIPEWSLQNETTLGVLMAFLAATLAVAQRVISEPLAARYEEETILYFHWGLAALLLMPYGLSLDFQISMIDILWLFLLGSCCTLFAQNLFMSGMFFISMNVMSMLFSLQPLLIALLAKLFLGEEVSGTVWIATGLVSFVGCFYHFVLYFLNPPSLNPPKRKKIEMRNHLIDYWTQEQNRKYEE